MGIGDGVCAIIKLTVRPSRVSASCLVAEVKRGFVFIIELAVQAYCNCRMVSELGLINCASNFRVKRVQGDARCS
jgi:hypothetical protein